MLRIDVIPTAVGIVQAIIFSFLILSRKSISSKDIMLLIWFVVFCIHLSLILLIEVFRASVILMLTKSLVLLHGPFFLLYTRMVFVQFKRVQFAHFMTFLIFFVAGLIMTSPEVAGYLEVVLTIAKLLTLIGYPIYVLYWLSTKLEIEKNNRADSFILDAQWIKSLSWLMISYACLGIIHILAELLFQLQFSSTLDLVIYALMITVIGFLGLKFGRLYTPDISSTPSDPRPSYKHSPLNRSQIMSIRKKIDGYFESKDDYLNPEFNLSRLSAELDAPKHYLSEVINLEMGTTFYDIVNAKRIQHAIQRMQEESESHITLEGLGYECGFNTKSAFYHHFKSLTGKTPGQFKSQIRPD